MADFTLVINEELWSTGSQSSSAWRQLVVKLLKHFKLVKKNALLITLLAMEIEGLLLTEVCLELRPCATALSSTILNSLNTAKTETR